jgi:hypothetical protein
MVIIETATFTRRIGALLPDDEYRKLQAALSNNPKLGPLIRGGGGLRKVRWAVPGKGKSGGIRVIYYWVTLKDQLLMLVAYAKSERDDLTGAQLAVLR